MNDSLLSSEVSLLSLPGSAMHTGSSHAQLICDERMKLFPLHGLLFPFLLLGEKTLCDPSFACCYNLPRKVDLNIDKVCASEADLVFQPSNSTYALSEFQL